jgi:hypothetical protein
VKSLTTEGFPAQFASAPESTQRKIRAAFELWSANPQHPSLRFKKVYDTRPIYSARVDLDWRAVGVVRDDTIVGYWVGPHREYEKLLKQLY